MARISSLGWTAALFVIAWAPPASSEAAATAPQPDDTTTLAAPEPVRPQYPIAPEETSAAVTDTDLALERGGQSLSLSDQKLQSLISGNSIDGGYRAGDVTISDSALANFNGFGNIVINTGAQTSLQAAMNVTINLAGD